MGTKIQANGFLREYHSVIDLDGSTGNGIRSVCHGNQIVENGQNPCGNDYLRSDLEKMRQTILEHELIFRSQLQELHWLYRRQKELMNEIKRREINEVAPKEVKSQSNFLFSPTLPQDASRIWNATYSMVGCSSTLASSSKQFPTFLEGKVVPNFQPVQDTRILSSCEPRMSKSSICPMGTYSLRIQADVSAGNVEKSMQERFSSMPGVDRDIRLSLSAVQTSQSNGDPLIFDLYSKRRNTAGEMRITSQRDGIPDSLVPANSSSTLNLATKDFLQSVQDGTNEGISLSVPGFRNERSRNHHRSDDYAEKMRFDKHSSIGGFCSGKSPVFPLPSLTEQRKELSRRTRKLFGVEIEGHDHPLDVSSKLLNGGHHNNIGVASSCSSSWIDRSFAENLELAGMNANSSKPGTLKADCKGANGNWLQKCSGIGLSLDKLPTEFAENGPRNCFAISQHEEVLKEDPQHSEKFQHVVSQHGRAHTDCQNHQENPKGALPWFLKTLPDNCDPSKGAKSPYFMNLDSLQHRSQNFFRKTETADGTSQAPVEKEEILGAVVDERSKVATKILGFPISDMLQSSKDLNPEDDLAKVSYSNADVDHGRKFKEDENKNIVLQKGIDNYISNLRHHRIDLNLSLEEEAPPSTPSLPTTIVKIATTEIDLEAPAVIETDMNACPRESDSSKRNLSLGKSELAGEECDKIAAEALLAISLHRDPEEDGARDPPEAASSNCLKWFAEIVSSQRCGSASVHVEVEEESIPDGMDYFEYMTLKLEETKEEEYHCEPAMLKHPTDDETGNAVLLKRSRRGQPRRGRQRKDFQRDILPGLVTLSRLEVTEDLQAFLELKKAESGGCSSGSSQRSSTRNGRGRKRLGCPTATQQPNCQLEDRSLTGWGKRTRRLPRQRCHNAFLSFPVKC